MAIKRTITKEEYDKLSKEFQAEYGESNGSYILDLTDYEDPVKLKSAKDHEKEQRKAAEKALREAQEQLTALTEERDGLLSGAIPKKDVEKLTTSYQQKLAAREKELTTQISALESSLTETLVTNVATGMASEISISPEVILPHITRRLKVDKGEDGKFTTRVLDAQGQPSVSTVEDLKKEFLANKAFAPLLVGSKGSGGGSHGGSGGGGGAPTKIDFASTPKSIAAAMKTSGKLLDR